MPLAVPGLGELSHSSGRCRLPPVVTDAEVAAMEAKDDAPPPSPFTDMGDIKLPLTVDELPGSIVSRPLLPAAVVARLLLRVVATVAFPRTEPATMFSGESICWGSAFT